MKPKRKNIAEKILDAETVIGNALADPGVREAIENYGYGPEKLSEGKELLAELKQHCLNQKNRYAGQAAATHALKGKMAELAGSYIPALKVARVVFNGNLTAREALALQGRRKRLQSRLLAQTEQFYKNLLTDESMLAEMAAYGFGRARLEEGQALTDSVREAFLLRELKKGEARQATVQRDALLNELTLWVYNLKIIAAIALANKPQWLEKLGIVVKS